MVGQWLQSNIEVSPRLIACTLCNTENVNFEEIDWPSGRRHLLRWTRPCRGSCRILSTPLRL